MIIRCGLLLLFLSCVRTTENVYENGVVANNVDGRFSYSFWPSVHNAAKMMRLRKRQAQGQIGPSEAGEEVKLPQPTALPSVSTQLPTTTTTTQKPETPKGNVTTVTMPTSNTTTTEKAVLGNDTKDNDTSTVINTAAMDINNPGVLKRGFIVFGGFALMAVAYFIFYRRKNSKNVNSGNTTNNDAIQFRYGVLQTDDRRDNLELSRVPLTMESDEEEDEDLEIFDLEQKKKSLSYVNLQVHDEDVVLNSPTESTRANDRDRDNLLLDIEDASQDTLINWSK